MNKYTTLWDVFPRITDRHEIVASVEEVKEFLAERGRTYCSPDEAIFLATLDRNIKIFTKAKEMVSNSKFSVVYRGPEYNDNPAVDQFEVIPIKVKEPVNGG